jgi:CDP-diacylglycerol--serine O-phosphatidyltransferase
VCAVRDYASKHLGCGAVVISAQIESELADLPPEEAREFLAGLGVEDSGVGLLIRAAYHLLGLRTYLTTGPKETRAWTIHAGDKAPAAAGVISSLTLLIIWLDSNEREIGNWKFALAGLMALLSYLMVSNLEYPSFKAVNWRTKRSFHWVLITIVVIAFTVMNWHWMPSVIFVSYLLYGLARPWISRQWRQEIEIESESAEIDPDMETLALNGEEEPRPLPRNVDPAAQI